MKAPRSIGDYRVITLIGVGGSASVYRAVRANDDVQVAIKVLADNHSAMAESRRRFTDEWRLLARVDHPSIATVYDAGETEDGQPYMVLELANRGDLRTRVGELSDQGYQIGAADVRILADHLRDSLTALHAGEVVHRDISPSNILISNGSSNGRPPLALDRSLLEPGERFLLSDLGFAKRLADASGLTRGGGTERFAAPEQRAAVSIVDQRADVFSATALIQWLVTGTPIADRLSDFIATGTAEDPQDRHADIDSWYLDLDQSLRSAVSPLPATARRGFDQDAQATREPSRDGGRPGVVGRVLDSVPAPRGPAGMVAALVIVAIATAAALLVWPASTSDTSTGDENSDALGGGDEGVESTTPATDQDSLSADSPSGTGADGENPDPTVSSVTVPSGDAGGSSVVATTGPATPGSAATDSSSTAVDTTEPSSTAVSTTPPSTSPSTTVNEFPFSPRAYLGDPADGAVVEGDLVVSGTAESPDGVASVLLVVSNIETGDYWHDDPGAFQDDFIRFPVPVAEVGATETTWTYTVPAADLLAGTYRIRVWARSVDGFGDPLSDTRTITISK